MLIDIVPQQDIIEVHKNFGAWFARKFTGKIKASLGESAELGLENDIVVSPIRAVLAMKQVDFSKHSWTNSRGC